VLPWHGPPAAVHLADRRSHSSALVLCAPPSFIRSGLTAQALAPLTVTDKPGNLADQNVSIGGTLWIPGEVGALQVTHGDCGPYSDKTSVARCGPSAVRQACSRML
jgi:hypothetical protein